MGQSGGGFGASEDKLYDFQDQTVTSASDLHGTGLGALMVIGQLAPGLASPSGGLDSLTTLDTNHQAALSHAMEKVLDAAMGVDYLGQGAGLIAANYHFTDLAAASGVHSVDEATIDALLTPAPEKPADQKPPTAEEQQYQEDADAIAAAIMPSGKPGTSVGPVMNPENGALTVHARAVPALPAMPAPPGRTRPAAPAPTGAPAVDYTTAPEGELPPDTTVIDPRAPSRVFVSQPTLSAGGLSGGSVTVLPGTKPVYDEEARRRPQSAEELPSSSDDPVVLAPGEFGHSSSGPQAM
ncbi:MAG: hypothetical protein ACQSGP_19125 [Frankia sp.]